MGIFDSFLTPNIEKLKAKKDIKGLIKAHKHKDYNLSRRAESAIVDLINDAEAEEDVETLIMIFEGDKAARMSVVDVFSMGNIKDTRVVEPFIKALKDEEAGEWLRGGIISALCKIKDERAVEPLIEILHKKYPGKFNRGSAAEALGTIGGKRAIEPLIEILKGDPDSGAREGAVKALRTIGDKRAIEPLIEALRGDTYWLVRANAADALGTIGGMQSIEPLIEILRGDAKEYVCECAADALGTIGDEQAIEPLIEALRENTDYGVRKGAARALGTIGDKRAIEPLIEALRGDADKYVRECAAKALGAIGDMQVIEPLMEILRGDADRDARKFAASALGSTGDMRAIEPLEEFLNDEKIGHYVKLALKNIREGVKKEEGAGEKQIKYSNPDLMARAEKDAMAMEDLGEAVKALASIYDESGGGRFSGLHNYIAGKQSALSQIEKYLSGDSDYNYDSLNSWLEHSKSMPGDDFHSGTAEILSWALDRI